MARPVLAPADMCSGTCGLRFVAAGSDLFFTGADTEVLKVPLEGGDVTPMHTFAGRVGAFAADAETVYVAVCSADCRDGRVFPLNIATGEIGPEVARGWMDSTFEVLDGDLYYGESGRTMGRQALGGEWKALILSNDLPRILAISGSGVLYTEQTRNELLIAPLQPGMPHTVALGINPVEVFVGAVFDGYAYYVQSGRLLQHAL